MGLLLEKEQTNGISLKYHRIVSLNIIVNECNIIEVQSYISPEKRLEEKNKILEGKEKGEAIPMNVYTSTEYISIPYDENMNIVKAYEYLSSLEQFEGAQTYDLNDLGDGVQEVIKKEDEEMPLGDYTNPILFENQEVELGKWYYDLNIGKDLPKECIKSGVPTSFNDTEYLI